MHSLFRETCKHIEAKGLKPNPSLFRDMGHLKPLSFIVSLCITRSQSSLFYLCVYI